MLTAKIEFLKSFCETNINDGYHVFLHYDSYEWEQFLTNADGSIDSDIDALENLKALSEIYSNSLIF